MLKAAVKRVLAPVLLHLGYYHARLGRLRNRALVVMYHRVTDKTPPARRRQSPVHPGISAVHFETQIRYLKERMNPIPLEELVDRILQSKPLPERAVAITFDDGYEDNYTTAYPILRRYHVPATVFVVAGFLGSRDVFWWEKIAELFRATRAPFLDTACLRSFSTHDDGLPRTLPLSGRSERSRAANHLIEFVKRQPSSQIPETLGLLQEQLGVRLDAIDLSCHRLLTLDQLCTLATDGIAVGAHTLTHPNLATIEREEDLTEEIRGSKRLLEDITQKPITGFAYPYGFRHHYTPATRRAVVDAGFLFACTARPGALDSTADRYEIPRISAPSAPLSLFLWQLVTRGSR